VPKNRPFKSVKHFAKKKTFQLELLLLPHQTVLLPNAFRNLAQLPDDAGIVAHPIASERWEFFPFTFF
jgi:hypothetical protein